MTEVVAFQQKVADTWRADIARKRWTVSWQKVKIDSSLPPLQTSVWCRAGVSQFGKAGGGVKASFSALFAMPKLSHDRRLCRWRGSARQQDAVMY